MSEQQKSFLKLRNESGSENIHYSVVYEGFPEEFKLIAEKELNETDELRNRGLQKLKDFMKKKNTEVLEDYLLLSILRVCKYDFKKSEARLEKFLKKRRDVIELILKVEKKKIEYILDDCAIGFLPYRDKHGRGLIHTRPYGLNMEGRYELDDLAAVLITLLLFVIKFPISSVAGFCYFAECESPSVYYNICACNGLRKFMFHVLAFPIRISKIEVINEIPIARAFKKVMTPFVSKKLMSRVSLNGYGYDNLHKEYDPDMLPEEYGGNLGPINATAYKQMFLDFIEDLKKKESS